MASYSVRPDGVWVCSCGAAGEVMRFDGASYTGCSKCLATREREQVGQWWETTSTYGTLAPWVEQWDRRDKASAAARVRRFAGYIVRLVRVTRWKVVRRG